jgi:hypothetical protein
METFKSPSLVKGFGHDRPAQNEFKITFCLNAMALEGETWDELVCFHMACFHISSSVIMPQPKL